MTAARAGAVAASLALVVAVAVSWLGPLDRLAGARTQAALQRALVTYAVARTLNGVISVAQGTELAFEPGGVGVVVTPGEILDPLNDLVEQFSWLTLLAATSLGAQIVLGEILAAPIAGAVVSVIAALALVLLWLRPGGDVVRRTTLRLACAALFVRFAIVLVALCSTWLSDHFLAQREADSVAFLRTTGSALEARADAPAAQDGDGSALDRFIEESRETLDVRARLARLRQQAEAAIGHVVNLIAVYFVETLLLPIGVLLLGRAGLQGLLRAMR